MSEDVKDKVANIGSVYASQQESGEIDKFNVSNKQNTDKYRASLRQIWKVRLYEEIVIVTSFITFNYVMFKKKMPKETVLAIYVAELYYFLRILQTTQANVVAIMTNIGETRSQIKYLHKLVGEKELEKVKENKIKSSGAILAPALQLNNVSFKYDKGPWIIKNLNLKIKHGERIFIKGPSGSGKTTLFQLILQALKPTKGSISVYGHSDSEKIRNEISLVDQRTNLFNETVMYNIKYGNPDLKDETVKKFVKKLNTNIFNKLSKGLYTNVGIDGSSLSGGQRQLVVLLRTYFRKSRLILLDEVVSGIDTENIGIILKMIDELGQNRTLLVISHNERISEILNRTVHLDKNH
jgi:ABC-type multidrug transport system fused ATPase/permease subunit